MKPKHILMYALFVAVVLAFFYAISGSRAPYIPGDDDHRQMTVEKDCQSCHAPAAVSPLGPKHPPKDQCFSCHNRKKKRL